MKRTIALLFACLMIVTTVPANVAAQSSDSIAFGIEYDYSNINADVESMIGLDLTEVFQEVMAAGDDAGIDLLVGRVTTGTTQLFLSNMMVIQQHLMSMGHQLISQQK